MNNHQGFLTVAGQRLEYRRLTPRSQPGPTLVFLHEGLGCIALWRDFPERVAATTGLSVFSYSRAGYGCSDPAALPRPVEYMHHEAQRVLPQVLAAAGIERSILIGHSDGASIALIYAGGAPALKPEKLVLLAPHVFNEPVCIQSIRAAGEVYRNSGLRARLACYHQHVDNAFYGWHDAWLQPAFEHWNIEEFLPAIDAPTLLIQGEDDEYGTSEQLAAIERGNASPVQRLLLPACGHAPHQDASEAALRVIVDFVAVEQ